ncbi:hypothetical protein LguiA_030093 [Lonicera macranthoides]
MENFSSKPSDKLVPQGRKKDGKLATINQNAATKKEGIRIIHMSSESLHGTTSDPPPPSPPALVFAALTLVSHTLTVAIFLIQRNRHALIGRAIDDNDMKRVLQFLKNDPLILNQPVFHVTTGSALRQVLLMAITSRDTALGMNQSPCLEISETLAQQQQGGPFALLKGYAWSTFDDKSKKVKKTNSTRKTKDAIGAFHSGKSSRIQLLTVLFSPSSSTVEHRIDILIMCCNQISKPFTAVTSATTTPFPLSSTGKFQKSNEMDEFYSYGRKLTIRVIAHGPTNSHIRPFNDRTFSQGVVSKPKHRRKRRINRTSNEEVTIPRSWQKLRNRQNIDQGTQLPDLAAGEAPGVTVGVRTPGENDTQLVQSKPA